MKRLFFYISFVCLTGLSLASMAQISYRGSAVTSPKKKTPPPKKVIPKSAPSIKPAKTAPTATAPPKKTVAKPKSVPKKPVQPRKIIVFPKQLFAHVRADFVGFYTEIKGFVPQLVLFKLKRTTKPGVKIKEYAAKIGRVVPASSITSKLEIMIPKNIPPGYYDVYVVSQSKQQILMSTDVLISGITNTGQSFFTNIVNGVVSTFPMLTVVGYGFGENNKANSAYLGNMRLSTIISWNDSLIKFIIPYWINTGENYTLMVRNSKGVEIPKKSSDPLLKVFFTYKGIKANIFNADLTKEDIVKFKNLGSLRGELDPVQISKKPIKKMGKQNEPTFGKNTNEKNSQYLTLLQIKGIGFGKDRKDTKVFLNSTEATQVVSWSDTLITLKVTAFRPGKYISKVFLNPNNRWKKNVYASRDSFYVWGRIPYKVMKIIGANYALSLKKSQLPSEMVDKTASYIYTLPQDAPAELAFYDAAGKNMYAKIFGDDKMQFKGRYKITYNTTDLSSGKYLLVFTVNKDKFMKIFHPVVIR